MTALLHRRTFVTSCAVSAAGLATVVPSWVLALDVPMRRWVSTLYTSEGGSLRNPQVRVLTDRALEAARSAGAEYADVQVTCNRYRKVEAGLDSENGSVEIGFSVRTLVRGYWGWAATPLLTEAEVVRIARQATESAKILTKHGGERVVEWVPMPTVQNGDWTTPIEVDPFTMHRREIAAFLAAEKSYAGRSRGMQWNVEGNLRAVFTKMDRVFASTEGSYGVQTRYVTGCGATLSDSRGGSASLRSAGTAQAGWEHVRDQPWRTSIPALIEEMELERRLPVEGPLEIGRYDLVLGAEAMAAILGATVGAATRIGRASGLDANRLGSSYLGPHVLSMLGTPVASPLVSILGNRSRPKALATVPWDDEGVRPENFPIITNGVLVDYLTTREQAPWLKTWYAKQGLAVRSRGCASSWSAHYAIREKTPNLEMHPGVREQNFDDLVADLGTGIAIRTLDLPIQMDWQCLNGLVNPKQLYRIRNGKRVARIDSTPAGSPSRNALMFRAPELLKSIIAIGGAHSLEWSETVNLDGSRYSMGAVPATVKQVTIVDPSRRA